MQITYIHKIAPYLLIVLLFACKKDVGLFYYPPKMAEYLELREEQENDVMPVLNSIQKEIFTFFETWRDKSRDLTQGEMSEKREEFEEERTKTTDLIKTKVNTLTSYLDKKQKKKLLNIHIPELYFQEAMLLFSEYQRELSKNETPTVKVVPTLAPEDIPDELPEYSELLEQWTVTFGMRRNGSKSILIGNRGSSGNGRFPLRIKATLIDPLVDFAVNKKSSESKNVSLESFSSHLNNINLNEIVIQISLSTYYHESYLDLNNWIVYLENDNIGQFEPVRIETRETPFVKEPKMFNFFSYPDDEESPEMPQSRSQQQRFFRDPMKTAFYRIVFKNKTNGDPIITEYTRFLKLVFLKEIGTNEKAEGKWVFEIPNKR